MLGFLEKNMREIDFLEPFYESFSFFLSFPFFHESFL